MNSKQTQIKLNLPEQLKAHIEKKAKKFGITQAAYIKHLIVNDAEEYPIYKASESVEKAYKDAIKNRNMSAIVRSSKELDEFFDSL